MKLFFGLLTTLLAQSAFADCAIVSTGSWDGITMTVSANEAVAVVTKYDPLDRNGFRTQAKAYAKISDELIKLVQTDKCSSGAVVETFWFSETPFIWFEPSDTKAERLQKLTELKAIYERNAGLE